MTKRLSNEIKWFCYNPIDWQRRIGYGVLTGEDDCRASVADGGRSVGFHQCGVWAKETIGGLRFCARHAKRLRKRLEEVKEGGR